MIFFRFISISLCLSSRKVFYKRNNLKLTNNSYIFLLYSEGLLLSDNLKFMDLITD